MKFLKKKLLEQKRRWRVRRNVKGTSERPRLSVCFSNKHVYAQCIDDTVGKTLVAICTTSKELKGENLLPNVAGAKVLGEKFGAKLNEAGVKAVVFDRAGYLYTGRVSELAEGARKAGLEF